MTTVRATPGPAFKSPLELQLPICGLTVNCSTTQSNGSEKRPCETTDLKCICKIDNDLSTNQLFNPACLYAECYNDLGREEWLDAFAFACKEVHNPLTSVPSSWSRYLPEWYNKTNITPGPSPTDPPSSTIPNQTASAPLPASQPKALSPAAIGGITLTCSFVFFGILILLIIHLRTRKTAKRKSKQVAVLQDQLSPDGFSQRIRDIWVAGNLTPRPSTPRNAMGPSGRDVELSSTVAREHYIPAKDGKLEVPERDLPRTSPNYGDGHGVQRQHGRESEREGGYGQGRGGGEREENLQNDRMSQASTWVDSPYVSPYNSPGVHRGDGGGGTHGRMPMSPRAMTDRDLNRNASLRGPRVNGMSDGRN